MPVKAKSSLSIGAKAVNSSEEPDSAAWTSSDVYAIDPPSTPKPVENEDSQMESEGPMTEVEEIPLATRFWRTEHTQTPRETSVSRPPPPPPAPAVPKRPPISRALPIQGPPPPNLPSVSSIITNIPHSKPAPSTGPSSLVITPPAGQSQHVPSAPRYPNTYPHYPNTYPHYRTTHSYYPSASPHTPANVHEAARNIVNSIDRPSERMVHPPMVRRPEPLQHYPHVLMTPYTPATGSANGTHNTAEDEAARKAAKRKSGWANWLRKVAGEKQRTLEEWHEVRIKRRRGIAWMRMMIEEFGLAPSPAPPSAEAYSDGSKPAGSVMSFANTLAALGHPAGPAEIKRLGGPGNGKAKEKEKEKEKEKHKQKGKHEQKGKQRATSPWEREQETERAKSSTSTAFEVAGSSTIVSLESEERPVKTHLPTPDVAPEHEKEIVTPPADGDVIVTPLEDRLKIVTPKGASKRSVEESIDSRPKKRGRPSEVQPALVQPEQTEPAEVRPLTPPPTTSLETDANGETEATRSAAQIAKDTAKRKAIAARNGAPMGWAFVDPNVKPGSRLVSSVEADLPRSARRARTSLLRDEAIESMSSRRLSPL